MNRPALAGLPVIGPVRFRTVLVVPPETVKLLLRLIAPETVWVVLDVASAASDRPPEWAPPLPSTLIGRAKVVTAALLMLRLAVAAAVSAGAVAAPMLTAAPALPTGISPVNELPPFERLGVPAPRTFRPNGLTTGALMAAVPVPTLTVGAARVLVPAVVKFKALVPLSV